MSAVKVIVSAHKVDVWDFIDMVDKMVECGTMFVIVQSHYVIGHILCEA